MVLWLAVKSSFFLKCYEQKLVIQRDCSVCVCEWLIQFVN